MEHLVWNHNFAAAPSKLSFMIVFTSGLARISSIKIIKCWVNLWMFVGFGAGNYYC